MDRRFARISLDPVELAPYRAAIIACSRGDEQELCERLLGQLASLEAKALSAAPGGVLEFVPPRGGSALARRALEHLRAQPLRRRARFERERARSRHPLPR
jgi:hypothetical protein